MAGLVCGGAVASVRLVCGGASVNGAGVNVAGVKQGACALEIVLAWAACRRVSEGRRHERRRLLLLPCTHWCESVSKRRAARVWGRLV